MEKLFAALIPVVCVMALGPLCCQTAGKLANRQAARALDSGPARDAETAL